MKSFRDQKGTALSKKIKYYLMLLFGLYPSFYVSLLHTLVRKQVEIFLLFFSEEWISKAELNNERGYGGISSAGVMERRP